MLIDTKKIFSMKEANQNFSRVARAIDSLGKVVIYKHNKPKYIIVPFDEEIDVNKISKDKK